MLTIFGKRWFNRRTGNTYHSVAVYSGKEYVGGTKFAYGYDSQYQDTAFKIAVALGLYSAERTPTGTYKDFFRFREENLFLVADVAREKDL